MIRIVSSDAFCDDFYSASGIKFVFGWRILDVYFGHKKSHFRGFSKFLWEHTGSNRGPSACKADALNQLSYAPFLFSLEAVALERECKSSGKFYFCK